MANKVRPTSTFLPPECESHDATRRRGCRMIHARRPPSTPGNRGRWASSSFGTTSTAIGESSDEISPGAVPRAQVAVLVECDT